MTIEDLTTNREWLSGVREDFEASPLAKLQPFSDPLKASLTQYTLRVFEVALDFHVESSVEANQQKFIDDRRAEVYVRIAATLGKEWTATLGDMSEELRFRALLNLLLYSRALAYVVSRAPNDPKPEGFLGVALLIWGAFYSRIEYR